MPPVGFETTISAGERPQTYALDRAATGTGENRSKVNVSVQVKFTLEQTTNTQSGSRGIALLFS